MHPGGSSDRGAIRRPSRRFSPLAALGCRLERRGGSLRKIATGMDLERTPSLTNRLLGNELEVVAIDEDHIKGTAFNIAFMVWRRRTRIEPFREGIQLVSQLTLRHPTGVGVMQVVETDALPPDSETRSALAEFLKRTSIQHFSVTYEGADFKGASVRGIVFGAQALARPSFAYSVHSTVADASRWAASQNRLIGRSDEWQAIERVMQTLRHIHLEKYPSGSG